VHVQHAFQIHRKINFDDHKIDSVHEFYTATTICSYITSLHMKVQLESVYSHIPIQIWDLRQVI